MTYSHIHKHVLYIYTCMTITVMDIMTVRESHGARTVFAVESAICFDINISLLYKNYNS